MKLNRRGFIKLGMSAGAVLGAESQFGLLARASELKEGGKDFSAVTRTERKAIPSACWQCVSQDGIIGYVEDGRIVKLEGNPELPRTNGRICAKGQAGINQVYDPDRILYPMKRMGKRGEGKWKRITWEEALDELTARLKKLLDEGHPEKFMFHKGRMMGSSEAIIKGHFLAAYGTATIGNHDSICITAEFIAELLTWGKILAVNDIPHTRFILNFGSNFFDAHVSHIPMAQRVVEAKARGVRLVTFDTRLSNTAARSNEWIPIRPGTDLAVLLAMAKVIMDEGLYDKDFVERWINVTVRQLKDHLKPYTPQWAEGISGVPASKIRSVAIEYARTRPATIVDSRGAFAHYNGVQTARAILMLEAICGNIEVKGGRCEPVGLFPLFKNTFPGPAAKPKGLNILGGKGDIAFPIFGVSHQIFKMIKAGSQGRPEIYMFYCHNPVFANGEVQENIDILKDEKLIPYVVAVDAFMSESTFLADLILPNTTFLEWWDWLNWVSYDRIPEYQIRQPLIKALGESRDFKDVCVEIAQRLGGDLAKAMTFKNAEEFVKNACENTPGVKEAGGFEYMKKHGAWSDKKAKPSYRAFAQRLPEDALKGTIVDPDTGVIWKGKVGEKYGAGPGDWTKYVGQMVKGKPYKGFGPLIFSKSGLIEISSAMLKAKGFDAMPGWMPIPEHEKMGKDDLILITHKHNVHTHSRTQNCKWLTEIRHANPAWIHPEIAAARGIKDGDRIRVKSAIGEIITKARVTEGIHPRAVAISYHSGHWQYGRYASGKAVFPAVTEPDSKLKWWQDRGTNPNWLIPNAPDPIAGQMRFMDTVVRVEKV